jgi:DNA-binding MarR family transcriptional regulator
MDKTQGYGYQIDITLKQVQEAYLLAFKKNNINLTVEQWAIVYYIHDLGEEAYQSKIAQLNFRNRATTSRVIKGLMEKGYVERFKLSGNKKEYFLRLTKSGLNLLEHVLPIVVGLRKTGVQHISKKDFIVFLNVLEQIAANYSTNKKSD